LRVSNKVAVVTGGVNGIGLAIVQRFVEEGARVVIADLDLDGAEALSKKLGDGTAAVRADVSVESDVAAAVDLAVQEFGQLDIMVNNAGILGVGSVVAETDLADWRHALGILFDGVFFGMKHAARVMVPRRTGVILSTSSSAGLIAGLAPHPYTACKHAVIGLTKSVANELAASGIRVNAIAPGSTVTPLAASAITGDPSAQDAAKELLAAISPLGIAALPEDMANAALYLASDEARYVTGHVLAVDAGQTVGCRRSPPPGNAR
jgi:NAD(P)-dependent dehydrogenase (short-subunit alcohol dehydrogenase family)